MSNLQQFEILVKQFMLNGTTDSLHMLAEFLIQNKLYCICILIIEMMEDFYSYNVDTLKYLAECYSHVSLYDKCWNICLDILASSSLSELEALQVIKKQQTIALQVQSYYNQYPKDIISKIKYNNYPIPFITFSITTCKRLDLFKRTMNSFLNCCKDIHLITDWICVDDNSSEEDRQQMRLLYPFFNFCFKNQSDKGHAKSMNIILNYVQSPYLLHIEDDWEFISPQFYIQQSLEILNEHDNLGQVLFNKNYAELFDINILGGFPSKTKFGLRYYLHEFETDNNTFVRRHGSGSSCAYWPHYSLRPSLSKTNVLKKVGLYNPDANHFEMEFAYRYSNLGFVTAFFESINCIHIGRLTSERFSDKQNAYVLNNESQFEKNKELKEDNYECFVVNLDNRPDRWTDFTKEAPVNMLYKRYSAVNGYLLKSSRELEQLFNNCDYYFRKGMIGCALSHLDLWVHVINSNKTAIILEDDVRFHTQFADITAQLLEQWSTYDICFLGHHKIKPTTEPNVITEIALHQKTTHESLQYSLGGTFAYIITPLGAEKMLNFIQENGMIHGIDTMMQKACDKMTTFYCEPSLVYSECIQHNINANSDIQNNYESLAKTDEERLENEYDWLGQHNIPFKTNTINSNAVCFVKEYYNYNYANKFNVTPFGNEWNMVIPNIMYTKYPILKDTKMKKNGEWNVKCMIRYKNQEPITNLIQKLNENENENDCKIYGMKHSNFENINLIDCPLSENGKLLATSVSGHYNLVICSSMSRCKNSLLLSKITYDEIIITDLCREQKLNKCDFLPNEECIHESWDSIYDRISNFRSLLKQKLNSNQYKSILVVSHNIFLSRLTNFHQQHFQDCEIRELTFESLTL